MVYMLLKSFEENWFSPSSPSRHILPRTPIV